MQSRAKTIHLLVGKYLRFRDKLTDWLWASLSYPFKVERTDWWNRIIPCLSVSQTDYRVSIS